MDNGECILRCSELSLSILTVLGDKRYFAPPPVGFRSGKAAREIVAMTQVGNPFGTDK